MTIQVRLCQSGQDIPLARIQASEKLKAIGDSALSDTFLTFALQCEKLGIESHTQGSNLKIRFKGSPYNISMHKAVKAVVEMVGSRGEGPFLSSMESLELKYGRELLSNAYSKLSRLVSLGKTYTFQGWSTIQVSSWLVDMFHLALNCKLITVSKATDAWLHKDQKHNIAGFWPACQVVLQAGNRFRA